ncbi:MAG: hypothetical protein HY300_13950 [Verrucomicrobia bacterium]|nr:hypothetical protein [Verrucomicrobiota bacterium]
MSLNSRVALAAALFVLLAAEWTDLNPLRHFSLGLLVVAAASWGRAWSWAVMITALVAWTATLPVTVLLLKRASLPEATVDTLRIVALITALAALVCSAMQPRQTSRPKIYHDDGWQPVKRFAFTLLCLLLGFQTISAFWPEAEPELPSNAGKSDPSLFPAASRLLASVPGVLSWSVEPMKPPVELTVSRPADAPIQLNAPELIFCNAGWRITERRLIPHGNGQAVALTLARGKEAAGAVFWFQNDDRAFVHYLRARQILWSGWNLNRRDLREVLLFSEGAAGPEPLIRLAETREWFRDLLRSAEAFPAKP